MYPKCLRTYGNVSTHATCCGTSEDLLSTATQSQHSTHGIQHSQIASYSKLVLTIHLAENKLEILKDKLKIKSWKKTGIKAKSQCRQTSCKQNTPVSIRFYSANMFNYFSKHSVCFSKWSHFSFAPKILRIEIQRKKKK